jgi:hypothetical protein
MFLKVVLALHLFHPREAKQLTIAEIRAEKFVLNLGRRSIFFMITSYNYI